MIYHNRDHWSYYMVMNDHRWISGVRSRSFFSKVDQRGSRNRKPPVTGYQGYDFSSDPPCCGFISNFWLVIFWLLLLHLHPSWWIPFGSVVQVSGFYSLEVSQKGFSYENSKWKSLWAYFWKSYYIHTKKIMESTEDIFIGFSMNQGIVQWEASQVNQDVALLSKAFPTGCNQKSAEDVLRDSGTPRTIRIVFQV